MTITMPNGWIDISASDLSAHLKECDDYVREAFGGGYFYTDRRTKERFALVLDDGTHLIRPTRDS